LASATTSHPGDTEYMVAPHNLPSPLPWRYKLSVTVVVLSATVFSRFAINLGSYQLNFSQITVCVLLAVSLLSRDLAIAPRRFLAYCACIFVAITSFVLNRDFSPIDRSAWTSLLFLVVVYFPLVFVLWTKESPDHHVQWTIRMFSNVALFCALAGIAQFYAQFVISSDWLFDFRPYIPDGLRGDGGNTVIPIGYGGTVYKSNGFFFREPSGASYVMALGLLFELAFFRRLFRMAVFAFALALTYSGTGLLALLIGIVFSFRWRTTGRMCAILAVAGLCAWAASDVLNLSFTLNRINEFSSEGSSGYARYVGPMHLVRDNLFSQPWSFWLGLGPGTISRMSQAAYAFQFHDPTWAKLLVEYGVLGFTAFLALMLVCIQQPSLPVQVKAVLFFNWLVMGGHLLTPDAVYLTFVLSGLLGSISPAPSGGKPEHVIAGEVPSAHDEDALCISPR
jgi:hypothetical protein